jgi:hypothetical protein
MKTCGKCGSDIPQPGPCPVCEDNPCGTNKGFVDGTIGRHRKFESPPPPDQRYINSAGLPQSEEEDRLRKKKRYLKEEPDPPANLHAAWWSCMQDLIKIKKVVTGFGYDEGPEALFDRLVAVTAIVKDYGEVT